MSGVIVIRYLLKQSSAVTAVIPAANIMAGVLPLGTVLPGISLSQITSLPFNFIKTNEANKMHTDRVQVSVILKTEQGSPQGKGWPGVKAALKLILAACPSQRGTVNGIAVDSIVPDIEIIHDEDPVDNTIEGSRDFIVKWIGA